MKLFKVARRYGRKIVNKANLAIAGVVSFVTASAHATPDPNPFATVSVGDEAKDTATWMSTDLSTVILVMLSLAALIGIVYFARKAVRPR